MADRATELTKGPIGLQIPPSRSLLFTPKTPPSELVAKQNLPDHIRHNLKIMSQTPGLFAGLVYDCDRTCWNGGSLMEMDGTIQDPTLAKEGLSACEVSFRTQMVQVQTLARRSA